MLSNLNFIELCFPSAILGNTFPIPLYYKENQPVVEFYFNVSLDGRANLWVYYLQKNNYDGVSMEVMDLNHQTMSQTISELRKKYGLSQQEFGERIGVSNRAVSKWENGLAVPSIDTGYQFAKPFILA